MSSSLVAAHGGVARNWPLAAGLGVAVLACLLAGWTPIAFSIVTVFLFAGPHNWLEARYLLTRMPARWGPLWPYFTWGLAGVPLLTAAFALLPWLVGQGSREAWQTAIALWNTGLVLWIAALVAMRSRQPPRRDWNWMLPVGLLLLAVNWLWPLCWSLALVYLHPLLALWFLEREITRRYPAWRRSYHLLLATVPLLVLLLWAKLAAAPNLPGDDLLSQQITHHAGGSVFRGVSTHFLVAAHTFLEMLHYGVWVVAIPLVSYGEAPWKLTRIPLTKRAPLWRGVVISVLIAGGLLVVGFWCGFAANYPVTRDIYFTVAMLHVLAEVPFLLRLL